MSVIQNNIFSGGFGAPGGPGLEPAGVNDAQSQLAYPVSTDRIRNCFAPSAQSDAPAQFAAYGGANDGGGLAGFTNIMNGFLSGLQNLLASLGQQFGMGAGGNPSGAAGGGQQYFSNATAASTGDPHDSFNGTRGDGSDVNGKWDSMQSHNNLLHSDSFNGGYKVSTVVTQPNANGVTMNDSATITTGNSANQVTMNKDGSYAVSSNGGNIALQSGQAVQLGDGASVTLNADKSLTETDSNVYGGTISTTMRSNGVGGVDVSNTAHQVDLGGYLVNRADSDPVEGNSNPWPTPSYGPMVDSAPTAQPSWSWNRLNEAEPSSNAADATDAVEFA